MTGVRPVAALAVAISALAQTPPEGVSPEQKQSEQATPQPEPEPSVSMEASATPEPALPDTLLQPEGTKLQIVKSGCEALFQADVFRSVFRYPEAYYDAWVEFANTGALIVGVDLKPLVASERVDFEYRILSRHRRAGRLCALRKSRGHRGKRSRDGD